MGTSFSEFFGKQQAEEIDDTPEFLKRETGVKTNGADTTVKPDSVAYNDEAHEDLMRIISNLATKQDMRDLAAAIAHLADKIDNKPVKTKTSRATKGFTRHDYEGIKPFILKHLRDFINEAEENGDYISVCAMAQVFANKMEKDETFLEKFRQHGFYGKSHALVVTIMRKWFKYAGSEEIVEGTGEKIILAPRGLIIRKAA